MEPRCWSKLSQKPKDQVCLQTLAFENPPSGMTVARQHVRLALLAQTVKPCAPIHVICQYEAIAGNYHPIGERSPRRSRGQRTTGLNDIVARGERPGQNGLIGDNFVSQEVAKLAAAKRNAGTGGPGRADYD